MSFLTRDPIDPGVLLLEARRDSDGGLAAFVGVVRDHNEGRPVDRVEYEAYEPMAEMEFARICAEVAGSRPGARLLVRHRLGALGVGDVAVVVVASAPHREEAFAACRDGIELIKLRAPIWKRETGPSGTLWVASPPPSSESR
ncbi:MAG: molybdenum cofactor biosynthesis protein MoaE [Acidobacteria bacterium]|nr:MAG: molybdenum cofactor biosynthesis protein MoaE [Acidobacteriota bacterium]MCE7956983.1 molybdenum cofactor biosynthesis protein MoaE [Acidobacteria bacterium ACB2]